MKLKMAQNSLFAMLLRSPWWVSFLLAAALALVASALLPADLRAVGALSALPFIVIGVIAARRQWRLPGAARIARTLDAVRPLPWPAFATLLERAFEHDGYAVQRASSEAYDFELTRQGRRTLVSARRWKSARTGIEPLRALQAAREAMDVSEAIHIGLGDLSDAARLYAAKHGIAIWQASELAHALRHQDLPVPPRS